MRSKAGSLEFDSSIQALSHQLYTYSQIKIKSLTGYELWAAKFNVERES